MIFLEKYFATPEISLKLKEKGFNENCLAYYNDNNILCPVDTDFINFREVDVNLIKAPLYTQIMYWLKDKKISVIPLPYTDKDVYAVSTKFDKDDNNSLFRGAYPIEEAFLLALDYL